MTDREIESKVKSAFTSAVPDNFDAILSKCTEQNAVAMPTVKKFNVKYMRRILSTAAVMLIVLTAGIVGYKLTDKNLSGANGGFSVADSEPSENDDFFKDSATDTQVQQGAQDDLNSTESRPQVNVDADYDKDTNSGDPDVYYPNYIGGSNGGGYGPNDYNDSPAWDVVPDGGSNATGGNYADCKIQPDDAEKIVLSDAKVTNSKIYKYKFSFDRTKTGKFYYISFKTTTAEYAYTIDADSGKIIESKKENRTVISEQKAKEIALEIAGATESEITNYTIDFEGDFYLICFDFGKVEWFMLEMDAVSGEVIEMNIKTGEVKLDEAAAKKNAIRYAHVSESEAFDYTCTFIKNGNFSLYEIKFKQWVEVDENVEEVLEYTVIIDACSGYTISLEKEYL